MKRANNLVNEPSITEDDIKTSFTIITSLSDIKIEEVEAAIKANLIKLDIH